MAWRGSAREAQRDEGGAQCQQLGANRAGLSCSTRAAGRARVTGSTVASQQLVRATSQARAPLARRARYRATAAQRPTAPGSGAPRRSRAARAQAGRTGSPKGTSCVVRARRGVSGRTHTRGRCAALCESRLRTCPKSFALAIGGRGLASARSMLAIVRRRTRAGTERVARWLHSTSAKSPKPFFVDRAAARGAAPTRGRPRPSSRPCPRARTQHRQPAWHTRAALPACRPFRVEVDSAVPRDWSATRLRSQLPRSPRRSASRKATRRPTRRRRS